ncbi:hypothetical protein QC764_0024070 [Podospora pseudoanserina]|uniref:Uncharacterized protein n=1 Tax=Podospora pseudoanserina TaxID=2609844 RepID=A0ABR0IR60_9PEZI|nr:hypothetical protein QC764_0024070 [Podospora pseudoanserina]
MNAGHAAVNWKGKAPLSLGVVACRLGKQAFGYCFWSERLERWEGLEARLAPLDAAAVAFRAHYELHGCVFGTVRART